MSKFTIPEINLLCIFAGKDKDTTILNFMSALPDFDDKEVITLAEGIIEQLDKMCESDFSDWDFAEQFVDDYDYE